MAEPSEVKPVRRAHNKKVRNISIELSHLFYFLANIHAGGNMYHFALLCVASKEYALILQRSLPADAMMYLNMQMLRCP